MNCVEANKLLNAYLDQQLDAAHALEVEHHIANCSSCNTSYRELSALKTKLRHQLTSYTAPGALRNQLINDLHAEPSTIKTDPDTGFTYRSKRVKQGIAFAASILIGFVIVINYQQYRNEEAFISELLSSHIRAISANRYTDINSSETNTIISWFARKLNFSPKIFNFSEQGFELAGGRLDSFKNQTIAAVTYKIDHNLINVYTWPSPDVDDALLESHNKQGYYLLYWCQNKMNYWVVSDGDTNQVNQLANMIQKRLSVTK